MSRFNRERKSAIRKIEISLKSALFVVLNNNWDKIQGSSGLGYFTGMTIKYSSSFSLHRSWTCQSPVTAPALNPMSVLNSRLTRVSATSDTVHHASFLELILPGTSILLVFLHYDWSLFLSFAEASSFLISKFGHLSVFSPWVSPHCVFSFFWWAHLAS